MDRRAWLLGTSMTASWAWGSSLMVGMAIMQQKGFLPFLVWASCNSLMLPFFGFMVMRLPRLERATSTRVFTVLMTVMQFFIAWVNMQAIYEVSLTLGIDSSVARAFAVVTGLAFILMVFRGGLELSIRTDLWQWSIMYVGVVAITLSGFLGGVGRKSIELLADGGTPLLSGTEPVPHLAWAAYGGASLLCGGFIDLQQWQRAKLAVKERRTSAFLIAGLLFAIYIAFVGTMALFAFTFVMAVMLMAVAYAVTTSTLDSVGAAIQEIGGNRVGAVLGIAAVAAWQLVYDIGIINIWNYYATFRLVIVSVMIVTVLLWHASAERQANASRP